MYLFAVPRTSQSAATTTTNLKDTHTDDDLAHLIDGGTSGDVIADHNEVEGEAVDETGAKGVVPPLCDDVTASTGTYSVEDPKGHRKVNSASQKSCREDVMEVDANDNKSTDCHVGLGGDRFVKKPLQNISTGDGLTGGTPGGSDMNCLGSVGDLMAPPITRKGSSEDDILTARKHSRYSLPPIDGATGGLPPLTGRQELPHITINQNENITGGHDLAQLTNNQQNDTIEGSSLRSGGDKAEPSHQSDATSHTEDVNQTEDKNRANDEDTQKDTSSIRKDSAAAAGDGNDEDNLGSRKSSLITKDTQMVLEGKGSPPRSPTAADRPSSGSHDISHRGSLQREDSASSKKQDETTDSNVNDNIHDGAEKRIVDDQESPGELNTHHSNPSAEAPDGIEVKQNENCADPPGDSDPNNDSKIEEPPGDQESEAAPCEADVQQGETMSGPADEVQETQPAITNDDDHPLDNEQGEDNALREEGEVTEENRREGDADEDEVPEPLTPIQEEC